MENLREKKERSLVVGLIALIVIIVVLALIGLFLLKPEPQIIQGQADVETLWQPCGNAAYKWMPI